MGRKRKLGDVELEILSIVWDLGEATVADVRDVILKRRTVAYTTVMTMMRNLAEKGFLEHRTEGRTYVYTAAAPAQEVRRTLLRDTVDKVFGGSSVDLVQNLLDGRELSGEEIAEIKRLIEEME
jgi:predicted transcriptional regulator